MTYVDENKTDGCQRCLANPRLSVAETKQSLLTPPTGVRERHETGITLDYKCLRCGYEWWTGWATHINGHRITYV